MILTSPPWRSQADENFANDSRLSHRDSLEMRKLVDILLDQIGEFEHTLGPLSASELFPWTLEGCTRSGDSSVYILWSCGLDVIGDDGVVERVRYRQCLSAFRFDKLEVQSQWC